MDEHSQSLDEIQTGIQIYYDIYIYVYVYVYTCTYACTCTCTCFVYILSISHIIIYKYLVYCYIIASCHAYFTTSQGGYITALLYIRPALSIKRTKSGSIGDRSPDAA